MIRLHTCLVKTLVRCKVFLQISGGDGGLCGPHAGVPVEVAPLLKFYMKSGLMSLNSMSNPL